MKRRGWFAGLLAAWLGLGVVVEGSDKPVDVDEVIAALQLEPHVEGGYFRRTLQADHRPMIETPAGPRYGLSSIYYLLTSDQPVGHWHLNRSDIAHYFHLGDPIRYYLLHPDGRLETVVMGTDLAAGQQLQLWVPGGVWKASMLLPVGAWGLVSEAVAPGFDYADMTLGERATLLRQFPQHAPLIEAFTRP